LLEHIYIVKFWCKTANDYAIEGSGTEMVTLFTCSLFSSFQYAFAT